MAADGRRGLGRGLSALLEESHSPVRGGPAAADVRDIPIELIHRNESQPRMAFPEEALEELANSIREKGVLQPILVRPMSSGPDTAFQIVAGERRWRASQRAGLKALPALVRELDDRETLEIALVENVQRADLNAIEEATAYSTLMQVGRTQDEVADVVGKSRPHVANTLRLLQLPPQVQHLVFGGQLSAGHARALIGAGDPETLAQVVVAGRLSVRETEQLAKRSAADAGSAKAPRKARGKSADTVALERDLTERLGLEVQVLDKEGRGEVRVSYQTLEQLDELCRRLTRG